MCGIKILTSKAAWVDFIHTYSHTKPYKNTHTTQTATYIFNIRHAETKREVRRASENGITKKKNIEMEFEKRKTICYRINIYLPTVLMETSGMEIHFTKFLFLIFIFIFFSAVPFFALSVIILNIL